MASFKFVIMFALIAVAVAASIEKPAEEQQLALAAPTSQEDLAELLDQYFEGHLVEADELVDEDAEAVREKRRICRVVRIRTRNGLIYIIRRCY